MTATISDLTEPIQSVLEKISVQELLEKVPSDVVDRLPERFHPEPKSSSHRGVWITLLLIAGAGVAFVMMRRRSSMGEDSDLDLRDAGATSDASLVGRPDASVLRP